MVWFEVRKMIKMEQFPELLSSICSFMLARFQSKGIWCIIRRLTVGAIVYFLWHERNLRIFSKRTRTPRQLYEEIVQEVRLKLMTLYWKPSSNVMTVKCLWNIN